MSSRDHEYLTRRARQERASAERTQDQIARRVHSEMADRYDARLAEIAPQPVVQAGS
ncbi:MAG: hypothetical protein KF730_14785 [Sphingomonas sp.]|uniref:hypothetical protein n=1 Tax=Sphingomonas sp. TaxID=28214 RepID=UPI0025FF21DA|nr:hypothetical protein [Sphingomonas sp.]MBX3565833.1 hypothetical protein [Sphingomonas sp.]